jgi:hypothetical protein
MPNGELRRNFASHMERAGNALQAIREADA